MPGLPAFLDNKTATDNSFGYYADDHCGNKIARVGLDAETLSMQVRNLEVMGYEVFVLTPAQQIALLKHEGNGTR